MARRLKQNTPRSRTAACIKTEHREKKRMGILKQFRAGKLAVIICSDRKQLGLLAGADAAEAIRRAIAEKGEANVMFAAAPSQDDTLRALCADCTVDWSRVNAFHMDEYIGLAETHPAGFRTYLKNRVFNRFTFKSVNLINGNAADIDGETERCAHLLTAHPLDVVLLGIGENGHIAFNDPSVADFSDKAIVKRVKLEQICRMQQVHDGCFASIDEVPAYALTVTIPAIMQGRNLICSAPCATKAEAAARMLRGKINTDCPAAILRSHDHACVYLDADSGKHLLEEG